MLADYDGAFLTKNTTLLVYFMTGETDILFSSACFLFKYLHSLLKSYIVCSSLDLEMAFIPLSLIVLSYYLHNLAVFSN